jgi:hypothetical protein
MLKSIDVAIGASKQRSKTAVTSCRHMPGISTPRVSTSLRNYCSNGGTSSGIRAGAEPCFFLATLKHDMMMPLA